MAVHKKYNALGKGLDALFSSEDVTTQGSSSINEIPISNIYANPNQPRREIDEESLKDLSQSIAQIGIIQPITLRQMEDGTFQIIAGERRWRASKMAGLATIPAYVRTASDENVMQMALVENIQREDLNAIEIALAYNNLMEQFHLTQEQLSEKIGKKRATIANYLRLLKLPANVQLALRNKEIDQGHARALLGLQSPSMQLKLFYEIQKYDYSVRKVEQLVQELQSGGTVKTGKKSITSKRTLPEEYSAKKSQLSELLKAKVQMTLGTSGKGKITIPFSSSDDLDRIMQLLNSK